MNWYLFKFLYYEHLKQNKIQLTKKKKKKKYKTHSWKKTNFLLTLHFTPWNLRLVSTTSENLWTYFKAEIKQILFQSV